jgi:hypothetical protein
MENITFKLLKDNNLVTDSAKELLKNKRVLLCSIHLPHNKLTHSYLKELTKCQKEYKKYGIDNICIIDSCQDHWSIPVIESFFPNLIVFLDYNKEFINFLKTTFYKSQSIEFLSKNWSYQLLLNNLMIEKFYEQPTENRLENLKKYYMKEHYFKYKNNDIIKKYFILPWFLRSNNEELVFNSRNNLGLNRQKIFYYNIWPNTELEKYLQNDKT